MNVRSLLIPTIIGLGLYAHSNNINLANNTTTLLEIMMLLIQQGEITVMQRNLVQLNCAVFGSSYPTYTEQISPNTTPYTPYGCCGVI